MRRHTTQMFVVFLALMVTLLPLEDAYAQFCQCDDNESVGGQSYHDPASLTEHGSIHSHANASDTSDVKNNCQQCPEGKCCCSNPCGACVTGSHAFVRVNTEFALAGIAPESRVFFYNALRSQCEFIPLLRPPIT